MQVHPVQDESEAVGRRVHPGDKGPEGRDAHVGVAPQLGMKLLVGQDVVNQVGGASAGFGRILAVFLDQVVHHLKDAGLGAAVVGQAQHGGGQLPVDRDLKGGLDEVQQVRQVGPGGAAHRHACELFGDGFLAPGRHRQHVTGLEGSQVFSQHRERGPQPRRKNERE